jgi:hypothetical protein
VSLPESFCNELDWYEGTEIIMNLDADGVFLEEEYEDE